jgi:hypothetical protein
LPSPHPRHRRRPFALALLLAAAAAASLPPAAALAQDAAAPAAPPRPMAPPPGLNPAVAACVIANLDRAYTEAALAALAASCRALAGPAPTSADGGGLLVRCKVAGDPEWVEFRLVTRGQCAAAGGKVAG